MILRENTLFRKYYPHIYGIFIFAFAFILRTYRLPEFIAYHQDQVRDLNFVKQHIEQNQLILLGPKASVGNFFLPPLWYYLMSIAYHISASPLTPALLVILFSSLTAVMIFIFCRTFFNSRIAFFASLLFVVSPIAIEYGRFAWNPNPIPFFTIVFFYFLFRHLQKKEDMYFYLSVAFANFAFQLHYQGFILVAICCLVLIYRPLRNFKHYLIPIILFLFLLSPFLIYESRTNFENTRNIIDFFIHRTTQGKSLGLTNSVRVLWIDYPRFIGRSIFFCNTLVGEVGFFAVHIGVAWLLFQTYVKKKTGMLYTFNSCYVVSLAVLFLYRQWIVDYYLLVLLIPLLVIFTALIFEYLPNIVGTVLLSSIIILNIIYSPTFWQPKPTLPFFIEVNKKIDIDQSNVDCIQYNVEDPDLQFVKSGVEYVRDSTFEQSKSACLQHYLICESKGCKNKGRVLLKNSTLGLDFVQL